MISVDLWSFYFKKLRSISYPTRSNKVTKTNRNPPVCHYVRVIQWQAKEILGCCVPAFSLVATFPFSAAFNFPRCLWQTQLTDHRPLPSQFQHSLRILLNTNLQTNNIVRYSWHLRVNLFSPPLLKESVDAVPVWEGTWRQAEDWPWSFQVSGLPNLSKFTGLLSFS